MYDESIAHTAARDAVHAAEDAMLRRKQFNNHTPCKASSSKEDKRARLDKVIFFGIPCMTIKIFVLYLYLKLPISKLKPLSLFISPFYHYQELS